MLASAEGGEAATAGASPVNVQSRPVIPGDRSQAIPALGVVRSCGPHIVVNGDDMCRRSGFAGSMWVHWLDWQMCKGRVSS